ncbi:TolC family protein [Vibrio rumoiensis]|uniref:TolC family protein n=1 Tax=Vibrio rumoiensis TaxID=76258 RepID=A0ABW7IR68_9VIBR|nr:TolC family protein [Vibrio rumoiensis]
MIKLKLTTCIGFFLLLPSFSSLAQEVTFYQAWQSLLNNNDGLAAERASVEQAEYKQQAASAMNLPSITLSANYTRLDDDITVSPSELADSTSVGASALTQAFDGMLTSTLVEKDVFTSSIRAIWPIFTGGRISAAQDIAKAKSEEAKYLFAMKQQGKFEDLSKYYFGVVLSQQVLSTRQEVEKGLKEHFDHAVKMEQQGQIARVQRLQAEAAYQKAKVDTKKAQRDVEIAQMALTNLIKSPSLVDPSTHLFINKSLPPMQAFMDKTLQDYPGLSILDAKEKQASGLVDVEKGKYYPEVYVYGNYNLYQDDTLVGDNTPDWLVGVGVSIPLLDSSGRSEKVGAAHSAIKKVGYLRAQAKQDLSLLVEKTYREANQALEEYNGLASNVSMANENIRLQKKAFSQGLATSLDVVDAEMYLNSIKTQRSAAAYQYVLSLSRLLAVSGEVDSFNQYQQYQGLEVQ